MRRNNGYDRPHGEAFTISDHLTVWKDGKPIYRPTVHYAYMPCDSAIASLTELQTRSYELQPKLRIMGNDIIAGGDELGCLLMGHDYNSWWIGSLLSIEEARKLVPGQNATTLQVAASVMAATLWMIDHPNEGVLLPDQLPHEEILKHANAYLGPMLNEAVDWDPLKNWSHLYAKWGVRKPPVEDKWQFTTFLVNNISGDGY